MEPRDSTPFDQLDQFGYVMLPGVFDGHETASLAERLAAALVADQPSVLKSQGQTYGSRDLARLLPEVREIPRRERLRRLVEETLGKSAGIVRVLYFDKPPERSWSLPWHKDRTIAVRDNRRPSNHFQRPTIKAGIPHVEAPEWLLSQMLTLRLHLDPMMESNGPLSVIPGSHRGDDSNLQPVELHAAVGDVLAMRPLVSHSSSMPHRGTSLHRRVIHLELAPEGELPDGYEWHSFQTLG